jgi:hypothetical protein
VLKQTVATLKSEAQIEKYKDEGRREAEREMLELLTDVDFKDKKDEEDIDQR